MKNKYKINRKGFLGTAAAGVGAAAMGMAGSAEAFDVQAPYYEYRHGVPMPPYSVPYDMPPYGLIPSERLGGQTAAFFGANETDIMFMVDAETMYHALPDWPLAEGSTPENPQFIEASEIVLPIAFGPDGPFYSGDPGTPNYDDGNTKGRLYPITTDIINYTLPPELQLPPNQYVMVAAFLQHLDEYKSPFEEYNRIKTSYGPYKEFIIAIPCFWVGPDSDKMILKGVYEVYLYLNHIGPTSAGREYSGFPKRAAAFKLNPRIRYDDDEFYLKKNNKIQWDVIVKDRTPLQDLSQNLNSGFKIASAQFTAHYDVSAALEENPEDPYANAIYGSIFKYAFINLNIMPSITLFPSTERELNQIYVGPMEINGEQVWGESYWNVTYSDNISNPGSVKLNFGNDQTPGAYDQLADRINVLPNGVLFGANYNLEYVFYAASILKEYPKMP